MTIGAHRNHRCAPMRFALAYFRTLVLPYSGAAGHTSAPPCPTAARRGRGSERPGRIPGLHAMFVRPDRNAACPAAAVVDPCFPAGRGRAAGASAPVPFLRDGAPSRCSAPGAPPVGRRCHGGGTAAALPHRARLASRARHRNLSLPLRLRSRFSVHPRPSSLPVGRGRRARRAARSPVERAPGAASDVSASITRSGRCGRWRPRGAWWWCASLPPPGKWDRVPRPAEMPAGVPARPDGSASAVRVAVGIDAGAFAGTDPRVDAHLRRSLHPPCGSRPLPSPARRCVLAFMVVLPCGWSAPGG